MKPALTLTIGLLILATYITLDRIYQDEMSEASNTWTLKWQRLNGDSLIAFFNVVGLFIKEYFLIPLQLVSWIFQREKRRAVKFITYIDIAIYFSSALGMIYARARPYQEVNEIETFECQTTYGKPGNHALNSVVVFGTFALLYIYPTYRKRIDKYTNQASPNPDDWSYGQRNAHNNPAGISNRYNNPKNPKNPYYGPYGPAPGQVDAPGKIVPIVAPHTAVEEKQIKQKTLIHRIWYHCVVVLFTFWVALIGVSKVYMGVHTFDQMILGWLVGLHIFLIIYFYGDHYYTKLMGKIYDHNYPKTPLYLGITAVFLVLVGIQIIDYSVAASILTYPDNWVANVRNKCNTDVMLLEQLLANSAAIAACYGFLMGVIYDRTEYIMQEIEADKDITYFLLFSFFTVLGAAIGYAPLNATVPDNANPYLRFFVFGLLKYFLTGFFISICPAFIIRQRRTWQNRRSHGVAVDNAGKALPANAFVAINGQRSVLEAVEGKGKGQSEAPIEVAEIALGKDEKEIDAEIPSIVLARQETEVSNGQGHSTITIG
jgi:membrane-associated phospholipid phosphatase